MKVKKSRKIYIYFFIVLLLIASGFYGVWFYKYNDTKSIQNMDLYKTLYAQNKAILEKINNFKPVILKSPDEITVDNKDLLPILRAASVFIILVDMLEQKPSIQQDVIIEHPQNFQALVGKLFVVRKNKVTQNNMPMHRLNHIKITKNILKIDCLSLQWALLNRDNEAFKIILTNMLEVLQNNFDINNQITQYAQKGLLILQDIDLNKPDLSTLQSWLKQTVIAKTEGIV